jgi:hypothetical protein
LHFFCRPSCIKKTSLYKNKQKWPSKKRKEEKEGGEGRRRRKEEKERGEGKRRKKEGRRRRKEEKERGEGKRRKKEGGGGGKGGRRSFGFGDV